MDLINSEILFEMLFKLKKYLAATSPFIILIAALCVSSCANIGNPSGGARDEDPPIFVSANPAPGSLNVNKTKITLTFNELINVKDAFQNVVVSPVSKSIPKVSSNARTITVLFDSLIKNQTYTIDFANSIEDNNEGNILEGFSYSFATGPTLDTLRISGMVLNSRNLEPEQGMIVGVHSNLNDSAFKTTPLLRVAKTDDQGRFIIRGLAPGNYRVFALNDKDGDWKYKNQEEDIAFYDLTVSPTTERVIAKDTIFTPLGKIDTILDRSRTKFLPNDILLRTFNSLKRSQYLTKYERLDSTRLFLKFNTRASQLPKLAIVEPRTESLNDLILERNLTQDSLVYWLPERLVHRDTLTLAVDYMRTDSIGKLVSFSDTLKFNFKRPKPAKNKKEDKNNQRIISPEDSINSITLKANFTPGTLDVDKPLELWFDIPLARLDTNNFHLEEMKDSVWRRVPKQPRLQPLDSTSIRRFKFEYPWGYDTKYRILADTMAAVGINGFPTRPISHEFNTKKEEDYCAIIFRLSGVDPEIPAFIELLNTADGVVKTEKVVGNTIKFSYLSPGKYGARLIEDANGNGEYDTGDYDLLRQPDVAYYFPKVINLKKNWDKEETWDLFSTPINEMKPLALKKNKPARKKHEKEAQTQQDDSEEETFDPTANPFDPNQQKRRAKNANRAL